VIGYGQGLASPKTFVSYGYAANAQYLSTVLIAGIELMLFDLLCNFYCHRKLR